MFVLIIRSVSGCTYFAPDQTSGNGVLPHCHIPIGTPMGILCHSLPGGDGGELVGGVEDPAGGEGVGGAGVGHALARENGWRVVEEEQREQRLAWRPGATVDCTAKKPYHHHAGYGHTGAERLPYATKFKSFLFNGAFAMSSFTVLV